MTQINKEISLILFLPKIYNKMYRITIVAVNNKNKYVRIKSFINLRQTSYIAALASPLNNNVPILLKKAKP